MWVAPRPSRAIPDIHAGAAESLGQADPGTLLVACCPTQPAILCAQNRGSGGGNVPTHPVLPIFSSNGLQSFE